VRPDEGTPDRPGTRDRDPGDRPDRLREQVVEVPLGERSYAVVIGWGCLDRLGSLLARTVGTGGTTGPAVRVALVSAPPVYELCGGRAKASLAEAGFEPVSLLVPDGEENKGAPALERLWHGLADHGFERGDVVVALGGGMIGDLAGFAAATYMRGIAFVPVPTTLLAQIDAAIGGKTGIDLPAGKNLAGAFHQPRLVVADIDLLVTLPKRELRSGLAELVKYALIDGHVLFSRLERDLEGLLAARPEATFPRVVDACRIKAGIVAADERDRSGTREALNLGHTLGHALEAAGGYTRWRHGEAVAAGLLAAAHIGTRIAGLPEAERDRLAALLNRAGLPPALDGVDDKDILARICGDKKVRGGQVRWVLPRRIGEVTSGCPVPDGIVREGIDFARRRSLV
jgi:3-dehydroquinate synthase